VYRCADLANALIFIESDIEKMEKEARLNKYKKMLRKVLRRCKHNGYQGISEGIKPDEIALQG
jgi:hypothetical protein